MKTKQALGLSLASLLVPGAAVSCIIPDRDIVVMVVDPCGEQWAVQTVGAIGYNGVGGTAEIKTEGGEWISKSFCLNAEQGAQMADPTSALASQALFDITLICQQRALEMGVADHDDTCATTADIAYLGKCNGPPAGCSEPDSETGDTEDETDAGLPDFWSLDLSAEITAVEGEYVLSQHLIDVALADPVSVSRDGTTATQVLDPSGRPRGFEIDGVTPDNLGGALGLRDGDVITLVAGQSTATYDDLLRVAGMLLAAERATMSVEREGSSISLRYRRAASD